MSDLIDNTAVPSGTIVVPPATTIPGAISKVFLSLRYPGVRKGLGMVLVFLLIVGLGYMVYMARQDIVDNADENASDIRTDLETLKTDVTGELSKMGDRLTVLESGLPGMNRRLSEQEGAVEGLRVIVVALGQSLVRLNSDFDRSNYRHRQEQKQ